MPGVRSMLARVARLEGLVAPPSPIERVYGTIEAFIAETQAGIEAGTYDPTDMPQILQAVVRWHRQGVWQRVV